MRRFVSFSVVALVLGLLATPPASAQQSLNLYVGGFVPRGEDARDRNDVLVNNLNQGCFVLRNETAAPRVAGRRRCWVPHRPARSLLEHCGMLTGIVAVLVRCGGIDNLPVGGGDLGILVTNLG